MISLREVENKSESLSGVIEKNGKTQSLLEKLWCPRGLGSRAGVGEVLEEHGLGRKP